MKFTVAHASLPKIGYTANGDAVFVRQEGSRLLLVVIDALGHGPAAAAVSTDAIVALRAVPQSAGLDNVVERVHAQLRGGRGAAALFLLVDEAPDKTASFEACSVGNVEARGRPHKLPLILTPGVLGLRLRSPRIIRGTFAGATRIVAYTDGISGRIDIPSVDGVAPALASSTLLQRHRREHDDATVAVADIEP